jgi:hypothetical protein
VQEFIGRNTGREVPLYGQQSFFFSEVGHQGCQFSHFLGHRSDSFLRHDDLHAL